MTVRPPGDLVRLMLGEGAQVEDRQAEIGADARRARTECRRSRASRANTTASPSVWCSHARMTCAVAGADQLHVAADEADQHDQRPDQ